MKNPAHQSGHDEIPPWRAATARLVAWLQLNLSCGLQKIPQPGFLWRPPRLSCAPQNRAGGRVVLRETR